MVWENISTHFFYCSALAIHYTKDRKKYLLKLYVSSIIMGFIDVILIEIDTLSKSHYLYYITNNIFRVIFTIAILISIIDKIIENKKKGYRFLLYYVLWQIVSAIVIIPNVVYSTFF